MWAQAYLSVLFSIGVISVQNNVSKVQIILDQTGRTILKKSSCYEQLMINYYSFFVFVNHRWPKLSMREVIIFICIFFYFQANLQRNLTCTANTYYCIWTTEVEYAKRDSRLAACEDMYYNSLNLSVYKGLYSEKR